MDFALTDDQSMIRDAAESFLADVSDSAAVRKAMASEHGYDESVWQRIASELGWCGIAVPEEYGGLGLGAVELVLVQEQIGRKLLCSPFFATVCLAANVLKEVGTDAAMAEFLPRIASGSLRTAMPLPSDVSGWHAAATNVRATLESGHWRLQGVAERLPDAAAADVLFIFAQCAEGLALFAIPVAETQGVQILTAESWDATRRFSRVLLDATLPADARVNCPNRTEGFESSLALARLYIAAEQLGAAQQCMDLTVAYTATRKQFGRVVGSFQAVKHRCAEMMVKIEALRSGVYGAAALAADNALIDELAPECMMARALAGDALFFCSAEAIQLHGGVGFTWEYDPQLYFKRAQASSHWLGDSDALRENIAQMLLKPALSGHGARPALAA